MKTVNADGRLPGPGSRETASHHGLRMGGRPARRRVRGAAALIDPHMDRGLAGLME